MRTELIRARIIEPYYRKEIKVEDTVLEFGCGSGVFARYLADKIGFKILFYDIKQYKTKEKLESSIPKVDIIMLNGVLHHIEDDNEIKELVLKLKPYAKKKILICEEKPTLRGYIFDHLMNLKYSGLKIPLNFKNKEDWIKILGEFEYINVKTCWWYPFKHFIMIIR